MPVYLSSAMFHPHRGRAVGLDIVGFLNTNTNLPRLLSGCSIKPTLHFVPQIGIHPQPEHARDCACSVETSMQWGYRSAWQSGLTNYQIYRTKSVKQMYAVLWMLWWFKLFTYVTFRHQGHEIMVSESNYGGVAGRGSNV